MNALRKVLVVDDDAIVGRSFDRVLSDKGYDVSTALDGQEALNKCNEETYDVVFTDIKMPGIDGLEVAKQIKARCPWTPVVVITGYGTEENEAEARVLGVNGFVRKPLTPEMIEGITLKALKQGAPASDEAAAIAIPQAEMVVPETAPAVERAGTLKDVLAFAGKAALFVAAPLIGLVYALFLPFYGLGLLTWMGARALFRISVMKRLAGFLKNVALFIAAPFIGLAYAILLPFVGLGLLAWMGVRTLIKRPEPN
ncbi:MAG: response regulator [Rhodospirillales bacterium]|nr:MAG: response regulator [Rhodospirillales bacterium]